MFLSYIDSYPFQTIARKLVHAKKAAHVSNQKKVYFHARVLKIAKILIAEVANLVGRSYSECVLKFCRQVNNYPYFEL